MIKNRILVSFFLFLLLFTVDAQEIIHMDIYSCIRIATHESLEAVKSQNLLLKSKFEYEAFKASGMPQVEFHVTPLQYNSTFIKRYDYDKNVDVYRRQQSIYTTGGISISQNVTKTGGCLTVESNLDYLRNFGSSVYSQFSNLPIRVGYSQSLFGFNNLKWNELIEPLKYQKSFKQYLYMREYISEYAVKCFFDLAQAQSEYQMAVEILSSSDSLYMAAKEKKRISAIPQSDLTNLQLNLINAQNTLDNAVINLQDRMYTIRYFLKLDSISRIKLLIPNVKSLVYISLDDAVKYTKENSLNFLLNKCQILEAEMAIEQIKKTSFSADLSASIGFNQVGTNLASIYRSFLPQEVMRVGVKIPIVDWGMRKKKVNMAKQNCDIVKQSYLISEGELCQEVSTAVNEFNILAPLIQRSKMALNLAKMAFDSTKERYIIGKTDISNLVLSLNRKIEAQRNYISFLSNYWIDLYKIRKLTLYDFEKNEPLKL